MLRSLGIMQAVKWFVVACVCLAIWQAYEGDLGAIVNSVWSWIQQGADVVQSLWDSVNNANNKKGNK